MYQVAVILGTSPCFEAEQGNIVYEEKDPTSRQSITNSLYSHCLESHKKMKLQSVEQI